LKNDELKMIRKIQIMGKHASLGINFVWDNIPKFAVIAGINGAGKTKLLELVYRSASSGNNSLPITLTPILGSRKIQYITSNHDFGSLNGEVKTGNNIVEHRGSINYIEKRHTQIIKYIKDNQKNNSDFEKLREIIALRSNHRIEDVKNMTAEEILNAIPPDAICYIENGLNNQYIAEIFKSYQEKVNRIKLIYYGKHNPPNDDQIYQIVGFIPPWDSINDLFKNISHLLTKLQSPWMESIIFHPL
jgi:hypothetical protein